MSADIGKTAPLRFLARRAPRASEALESLRARCGERQATIVARLASLMVQVTLMHKVAHDRALDAAFREAALCTGASAMLLDLSTLVQDVGVDVDHVLMLIPLLEQDVADAVRGVVHPPHEGGA